VPASTYLANKLLDHTLRGVAFTAPARVYVSLHTGDPGLVGSNEVGLGAFPAYVRKDPANGGAVGGGFDAAATKHTQNAQEILWPIHNGAGNVVVTHFGIWDAATVGNFLKGGPLTASKTFEPTDQPVIRAGELDVDYV
jgi:hypothetical protein